MKHLFGSTSLAVCMIDRSLGISKASEAAAALFDLPTLAGLQARDLIPEAEAVLREYFDLAGRGLPLPDSRFIADGRHYAVTFHAVTDPDSGAEALLAIAMDVSPNSRIEQALRTSRRRLLRASRRDHLTGLLNRKGFDMALHRELRRARRAASPLSLLVIDIDWFKSYNDSLGHQEGDRCLRLVAGALETCLRRASDHACRYGGEEFAIILPDTVATGAASVGAACLHALEALDIPHPTSPYGRLSASIGAASFDPGAVPVSAEALFATADAALYRAKQGGRNRCEPAAAPTQP
ncbi:sensor domain-containing diguanylate cyclase [Novosphingobium guangzhouense]|uniref:diguanylate cyclase n=1 Tax=Novosphingobium guangzhouense TaxID=1850347 RepID=A0A2K2FTZ9_9SPHN|nr:GGDEF domain-containing protein [Novosphingobium guangzhouense]PNU02252.1 hypothetical protein A8V01_10355 [Novosphingobium guangzhouense]